MLSRDRVMAVIDRRPADRIPVYAWVRANLEKQITEAFGSVEAFEDKYEFDFAHLFGGPNMFQAEPFKAAQEQHGKQLPIEVVLDLPCTDPNQSEGYDAIRHGISHHKEQRGRFVYVQTPGIFERLNGTFGMDNQLAYLLLNQKELHEIYRRTAEWNRAFAMNCLDLGVDMIHVSDDWGTQKGLMFSPDVWWTMIYPYHKITCDAVRQRRAYLSLHSDGDVSAVLDGIRQLGYNVLHPVQECAGMNLAEFKANYGRDLIAMGGLDVQTTIGFGQRDRLVREIDRVLTLFKDGGLLYCTTHFIQDHCTIEELTFAYDHICRRVHE